MLLVSCHVPSHCSGTALVSISSESIRDDDAVVPLRWRRDLRLTRPSITHVVHHSRLLPPSLTSLLYHYRITSFHLTLSSGRWSPSWPLPSPPHSTTPSTPASGIELYAFLELLEGESPSEEEKRWEGFVGALGGLVCTGINGGGTGMGDDAPASGYAFEGFGRKDRKYNHGSTNSKPKKIIGAISNFFTTSRTSIISITSSEIICNLHRILDSISFPASLRSARGSQFASQPPQNVRWRLDLVGIPLH